MPDEILIPLQSLISCFLEPPAKRQAAVGAIEGLWRGYSLVCPKSTICWAPVAVTQAGRGSSVLILLCAKDQANENLWAEVRNLADFPAGYEGDSLARFSHCFFLLSFSSLPGLEQGQNPGCLASGPNEAQALMSHCKNSLRDKMCSFSLPLSPACWHAPPLSSLSVFGSACPHASSMDSPAIF